MTRMIVAPDGTSAIYESHNPKQVNTAPNIIERNIIFLRFDVNCRLKAAGIVSSARTRIIPTTFISTTTVSAIKDKSTRYKCSVGTPSTVVYSYFVYRNLKEEDKLE